MLVLFDGESGTSETLRFIEEKGGAGLWSWDIKANQMDWSPGFYALLGLEPGKVEPSYAEINARTHPEDRRPPGQIDHVLAQALPINRTFRIIRPDGRVRWILGRGEILVDAQGAPQRSVGIAFDVTHHHEQLKTLEITDARFQALVKSIRAAIWMAQPDGHVTASLNWTELTDEDPANFLGRAWVDTLHPDDRERTLKTWDDALTDKKPYEIEHRARVSDGSYHWYKSRAMPVFNDDGSVREWLGLSYDITESKTWPRQSASGALTGAQIRAARGILNWSVRDLAEKAKVSGSTIRRLEESDGPASPGEPTIEPIRQALQKAGIEFLFPPAGKPGLRPA
jgi:PAS domain S-box-containing protein